MLIEYIQYRGFESIELFRHLSQEDAGNYSVKVKNQYGEKANHVRLSMKDENAPSKEGTIEPTFFRKPSSRQEGKKLHLECEIEALPRPEIQWTLGDRVIQGPVQTGA